ncbi:MAG: hypothetical protein EOP70_13095 [Variovorax sp.]|nr:MAG: hypothetical protein EOP70_13095 [Variovorax sp.]
MTSEQMLAEIKEANLTYLMLAQSLIRQDKAQALFRLGISDVGQFRRNLVLRTGSPSPWPYRKASSRNRARSSAPSA